MAGSDKKADIKAVLDYVQGQRQHHGLDQLRLDPQSPDVALSEGLGECWQTPAAGDCQERIREIVTTLVKEWDRVEQQVRTDYDSQGGDDSEEEA